MTTKLARQRDLPPTRGFLKDETARLVSRKWFEVKLLFSSSSFTFWMSSVSYLLVT